jgi:hypothetical protein
MPEVLVQFEELVLSSDGTPYRAQACGAAMDTGMWEGWIEFVPVDGGTPVRSPRETTQPNRGDAVYWATGLSATYLEGALARALRAPIVKPIVPDAQPIFTSPAPVFTSVEASAEPAPAHAILDPFSVYEKGETLLRNQLGALSAWHLVNIVVAYELSEEPITVLNRLPQGALIEIIMAGVRQQLLAP